jgi:HK97 family phage prohead protease
MWAGFWSTSRNPAFFMEKEYRNYELTEIRAIDGEKPVIQGHAAVFNTKSHDMGFREIIMPGAFTQAVMNDDVKFLLNHRGLAIARTKSGTLRLSEDQKGLAFRAELDSSDPDVQRLLPKVNRGDVSEMSFGFYIKDKADEKLTIRDGEMTRTLFKVSLFDVSAVSNPAYPGTDLQARFRALAEQQALEEALLKNGVTADPTEFLVDYSKTPPEARKKLISKLDEQKRRFVYVCQC